jgi:hypothetical protein
MTGANRRRRTLVWSLSLAAALTSLTSGRAEAELIGFWNLEAPVSAELLSGGTSVFFDWLNVANEPVTIEEAFTGHGILDDGYANFSRDTVVELGYREGAARNRPGSDLVLFDARFDANSYAVSTSYDEFSSELFLLASTFVFTGETRQYYYAGLPLPFTADIWAVAFDLSALGVPEGWTVDKIRVRGLEDDGGDLIGVGAIREAAEPSSLVLLLVGAALVFVRSKELRVPQGLEPLLPNQHVGSARDD